MGNIMSHPIYDGSYSVESHEIYSKPSSEWLDPNDSSSSTDSFSIINFPSNFKSNTFKSSGQKTPQERLGCNKVGLSIINSLINETSSYDQESKTKSIFFGQQLKINVPKSSSHFHESSCSSAATNSFVPRNTMVWPHLGSSNFSSRGGMVLHKDDNNCNENGNIVLISPQVICGSQQKGNHTSGPTLTSPFPATIRCSCGCVSFLTLEEIKQSEEYTCVTIRSPNPKVTHIFGDCILYCHPSKENNVTHETEGQGTSYQVANQAASSIPIPKDDFMKNCYLCKKKLEGIDTYMYRGDAAFCSDECRDMEISADRMRMKRRETTNESPERSTDASNQKVIFFLGDMRLSS